MAQDIERKVGIRGLGILNDDLREDQPGNVFAARSIDDTDIVAVMHHLRHLVEVLRDSKEKFTRITFDDKFSETIVFDHQDALKATDEILSDNGIREQSSEDLTAVWSKKK